MRTSHVGSFPLDYSYDNVKRAVLDMNRIGVDVPPYPQLRNFVEIYLKPLEDAGCLRSSRGVYFLNIDNIECSKNVKIKVAEAEDTVKIIEEHNIQFNVLRAPVTGPFTLASRIYIPGAGSGGGLSSTCLSKKELVIDLLTNFVINTVKYLVELGYNIVFIDEPVFNYLIGMKRILFGYKEDEVVEVLDKISSSYPIEFGVHVCGRLNPKIIEIILSVPKIKYMSIELHDTPTNLELVTKELLEKHDKVLSPGLVSSQKPVIEDVNEVLSLLRSVYRKIQVIDLVSGDCGFGGLKGSLGDREKEYNVAISKLRTVVDAVKKFKVELK
jgi:5-methyltetrahydropteroyltriglutamate--homocysteine methyltransferase